MDTKTSPKASKARNGETAADASIIRVDKRTGHWEAIPRALIDDERLNLDARWLAIWLTARPSGWKVRAGLLPTLLKVPNRRSGRLGRDVCRRMLRELLTHGYLVRTRTRTPGGRWSWESVFRSIPASPTMDGLAVDGSAVDGSTGDGKGVDLLHTDQVIVNQYTLTTTTAASAKHSEDPPEVVVSTDIRYPQCLKGEVLAAASALIQKCLPEQRQAVLDEVDAMYAARRVRSPIGLLHRLVERANEGQFVPNLSAVRSRSKSSPDSQAAAPAACPKTPAETIVAVSEVAERTLVQLRQTFK